MKSPASYGPPRRLAAKKKQFRLQLRRSKPAPEEEPGTERKSHFWKWVALVAFLHLLLLMAFFWTYRAGNKPVPPEQFISLVPEGEVVKGEPGRQEAPKVGKTTPAPAVHHTAPPPEPVVAVKPPPPAPPPAPPKPVVKATVPPLVADKPIVKPPPPKPKVKVDISHDQLVDNATPDKPTVKPKPMKPKKRVSVAKTTDEANAPDHDVSAPDNTGLSAQQVAKILGEKVNASGVKNSVKIGPSGSENAKANPFADFYLAVRDQVMNRWANPNLNDANAVNPIVQIHVEPNGRVPADSVTLIQSSGNQTYDDSALAAARDLGQLHEPLPDGCPPDISITFKLTR